MKSEQVDSAAEYRRQMQSQSFRRVQTIGVRGRILDRNGVVLADNITTTSLVLVPNQIEDKELVSKTLSEILGVTKEEMDKHVYKETSIERVHPEGRNLSYDIADKIIARNPNKEEYVCAAGISPSGSVHIGNFRDVATSFFVVKALQKKGKKAKLLFSWDDFDRLRKVPSNVQQITQGFEENIGKPYTFITDPFNQDESYGVHFEKEFEESLKRLGVEVDARYQTKNYTSGLYREHIIHSLNKRKEIYDILMKFKTQDANDEDRENYYPISIYCEHSLKDNTKVTSYDPQTGDIEFYCSDCQQTHKVNVNTYNLIKLVWKVDWPMRWLYENVDFEPGGKDHASINGSYDTSKEISKE